MRSQLLSIFDYRPIGFETDVPLESEPYPIDPSGKYPSPLDPVLYPIDQSNKSHDRNVALVRGLYQTYYHREADPAGLDYWVAQLDNGAALANVTNAFATTGDISPNAAQSLYDYLTAQGLMPASTPNAPGSSGTSITSVPIVGPIVSTLAQATGWSPGTIAIAGVVALIIGLSVMGSTTKGK